MFRQTGKTFVIGEVTGALFLRIKIEMMKARSCPRMGSRNFLSGQDESKSPGDIMGMKFLSATGTIGFDNPFF